MSRLFRGYVDLAMRAGFSTRLGKNGQRISPVLSTNQVVGVEEVMPKKTLECTSGISGRYRIR